MAEEGNVPFCKTVLGMALSMPPKEVIKLFFDNGKKHIEIDERGFVKLPEGATPDEASRAFWKALETSNPLCGIVKEQTQQIQYLLAKQAGTLCTTRLCKHITTQKLEYDLSGRHETVYTPVCGIINPACTRRSV